MATNTLPKTGTLLVEVQPDEMCGTLVNIEFRTREVADPETGEMRYWDSLVFDIDGELQRFEVPELKHKGNPNGRWAPNRPLTAGGKYSVRRVYGPRKDGTHGLNYTLIEGDQGFEAEDSKPSF